MGSRAERVRQEMTGYGAFRLRHSTKQTIITDAIGRQRRGTPARKVTNSWERRRRQDEFLQGYIAGQERRTMTPYQLQEYRKGLYPRESIERLFDGVPIASDIADVMEYGSVVEETYLSERETKVTITIVDFTRKDKL